MDEEQSLEIFLGLIEQAVSKSGPFVESTYPDVVDGCWALFRHANVEERAALEGAIVKSVQAEVSKKAVSEETREILANFSNLSRQSARDPNSVQEYRAAMAEISQFVCEPVMSPESFEKQPATKTELAKYGKELEKLSLFKGPGVEFDVFVDTNGFGRKGIVVTHPIYGRVPVLKIFNIQSVFDLLRDDQTENCIKIAMALLDRLSCIMVAELN